MRARSPPRLSLTRPGEQLIVDRNYSCEEASYHPRHHHHHHHHPLPAAISMKPIVQKDEDTGRPLARTMGAQLCARAGPPSGSARKIPGWYPSRDRFAPSAEPLRARTAPRAKLYHAPRTIWSRYDASTHSVYGARGKEAARIGFVIAVWMTIGVSVIRRACGTYSRGVWGFRMEWANWGDAWNWRVIAG